MEALWAPWPGPQTVFCGSSEFEVLFGGAKGPGKSDAILFGSTAQVDKPKYKALILRASFPELQELIDRSHAVFPHMEDPPRWNASLKRWVWRSGAQTVFGYCQTLEDVERYHGQEYPYIGYDELGNLREERVWERLMAECRCPDPTVVRMMRASANPGGPGHPWLKRRFVDRCGKQGERVYRYALPLPGGRVVWLTRRYIPARVTDNPVYANDPQYMGQLMSLPEVLRRQLLEGDWDAGTGVALDELDRRHVVPAFAVPGHWLQFGAFDWGYTHPFVFGHFAVSDDGTVYLVQTIRGRRLYDEEIFDRIAHAVDIGRLAYTVAGHDCWSDYKAMRRDGTPNTAERFTDLGLPLAKANINRPVGLNNLRHFLAWRTPEGGEKAPRFFLMDTPENQQTFTSLESMVTDPDNPEDALKTDADPLTGDGGDDAYDMVRYALASRPPPADAPPDDRIVRAFDRDILEAEAERRRHQSPALRTNARLWGGWEV
jgi:hypothetical protein